MIIIVKPNVTQALLRYYKELRTNPKYQISQERAWEKYSNFHKYIYGGIVNDLPKGRPCNYYDLGQRFNNSKQPKFPQLKYLTYVDESKFKWYIAYVNNEQKDKLIITRLKGASNVRCESILRQKISDNKQYNTVNNTKRKNVVRLTEQDLRQIIMETVRLISNDRIKLMG